MRPSFYLLLPVAYLVTGIVPEITYAQDEINSTSGESTRFLPFVDAGFNFNLQGAGYPSGLNVNLLGPILIRKGQDSLFFYDLQLGFGFNDSRNIGSSINNYYRDFDGFSPTGSYSFGYKWATDDQKKINTIYVGYDHTEASLDVSNYEKLESDVKFFDYVALGVKHNNQNSSYELYARYPTDTRSKFLYKGINRFSDPVDGTDEAYFDVEDYLTVKAYSIPTFGFDYTKNINSEWSYSLGYYYQSIKNNSSTSGSGAKLKVDYKPIDNVNLSFAATYDDIFGARTTGSISYLLPSRLNKTKASDEYDKPLLKSISMPMDKRDVRVTTVSDNLYECELIDPDKEVDSDNPPAYPAYCDVVPETNPN